MFDYLLLNKHFMNFCLLFGGNMDYRIRCTKCILREKLLEILNDKKIENITVTEICKKADINRATFYKYYKDNFDLLDTIKDDFAFELKSSITSDTKETITNVFNVINSNK